MAEAPADLESVCERIRSLNSPADWEQSSTLVFRLVGRGRAVTVSPRYLTVDISVHTDALHYILHSQVQTERKVFSLSWGYEAAPPPCQSILTIHVKGAGNSLHVLNTLSKDGFQQLRQFANMMFQEYETRITSVSSPPLSFQCTHKDQVAVDTIARKAQELQRKFKTYVLDNSDFDFEFHIRKGEFRNAEMTDRGAVRSLMDIGSKSGVHIPSMEDNNMNLGELERFETQLMSQSEHIETIFREQKERNYAMRSTLRSVLERQCEQSADLLETLRRDSGDGAEVFPSSQTNMQSKPSQEKQASIQDIARSKPLLENSSSTSDATSPKPTNGSLQSLSKQDTQNRVSTSHRNSKSLALQKSDSDNANRTLPNELHSTRKPSLQNGQQVIGQSPSLVTLTPTSVKENHEPKTATAKTLQTQNRQEDGLTKSSQHSSTMTGLQKSDHRQSHKHTSQKDEESPPRAHGMDVFLCFHITDKKDTDRHTRQQMKDAALIYIQCVEEIASEHDIEENIGLIAKEKEFWIKKKPTSDYTAVRANIENLSLECSTLLETLEAASDFTLSVGRKFWIGTRYSAGMRLVMASNHVTSSYLYGSPVPFPCDKIEFNKIKEAFKTMSEREHEMPALFMVGDADRNFLRQLSRVCSASCYDVSDMGEVVKFQTIQVASGRIINFYLEQGEEMSGDIRADTDTLMEMFCSHLDDYCKDIVKDVVRDLLFLRNHGSDGPSSLPSADLPPLGSRVVRGRDWRWQNQDTEGPGTVIQHLQEGWLTVEWDNGHTAKYRYGSEGAFDIKVVHDQPKENSSDSSIDVGCEVVRGPDWMAGNEDGGEGSVGVVIQEGTHAARVRWYENGVVKAYKFGRQGKYEVMLRDIPKSSATSTKTGNTRGKVSAEKSTEKSPVAPQASSSDNAREKSLKGAQNKSPATSQACSQAESLTTVQKETPDGEVVWQWLDNGVTWRHYSQEASQKLEASFNRRPNGSCLVKRDNMRVLFREMEEKSLEDNTRRRVQRSTPGGGVRGQT